MFIIPDKASINSINSFIGLPILHSADLYWFVEYKLWNRN